MISKYIKNISLALALTASVPLFNACTNLDETVYDKYTTDNYYNNRAEVLSAVLRPYTHANAWLTAGQDGWWRLSEYSADQLAWPVKGRHGQDGGKWLRLHYHTWTADEGSLNSAWNLMWWGAGLCTDPIENLEKRDISKMGVTEEEKKGYIAELKLFRAFHYLKIMDLWGNVPIVTQIGIPLSPPTASRKEVFEFIEKEIKDNIDAIPVLSKQMLGRVSKAAGYAMLTELYLNAEKWTGQARWDDCIAAADALISGKGGAQNGTMALDTNILDTYITTNDKSKEVIFSLAYEFQESSAQPQWPSDFFYFNHRDITGGGRNGNDGTVVIPGVFTKYKANDKRKAEWFLVGPQFKFNNPTQPVLGANDEYQGQPLVFVDNIRQNLKALQEGSNPENLPSNMTTGEGNSGVRFNKYKLGDLANPKYNSTDWNIYRLTWIYFAKAEAIMRKNGGSATQEAVDLINASKKRAFTDADWSKEAYTTASLTLDELLEERGREFIFEGYRRSDLIRFGKFTTTSWWDHKPTDENKNLFAIPNQSRILNQNLAQNPGYN